MTILEWLQDLESFLQECVTALRQQYDRAAPDKKTAVFMALSKAQERLSGVQDAIIEILQERIAMDPPSRAVMAETLTLIDKIEKEIRSVAQFSALLDLFSDLSALIRKTANA